MKLLQFIVKQKQNRGSGNVLARTIIYRRNRQTIWFVSENKNMQTKLTETQLNFHCGCGQELKYTGPPNLYRLCIQQEQKYMGLTEILLLIATEDNYDWLANNRTWKKWTGLGLGEVGSLSYAGIDFHKPKDEK
jgi:hypothetical protein